MKLRTLLIPVLTLSGTLSLSAADALAETKAVWKQQCARCHGEDGRGHTRQGRKLKILDLSDAKVQNMFTDEQAFKIIKGGLKDDDERYAMHETKNVSDDGIRDLVQLVRTFRKP